MGTIWIGTSGWVYPHWKGCFYPPELRQVDWLDYYAARFPTVEINRSYYRLPTRVNFEAWAAQMAERPGFCYAVKATRFITHLKKLREVDEAVAEFVGVAEGLGPHLGPFLYQLPPRWHADAPRLAAFLALLPRAHRAAVEFRDRTWYNPEVARLLDAAGVAQVIAIGGAHYTPVEEPLVGPFRYLRVHGGVYGVGLTDGELAYWAERIAADSAAGHDVYIYFNNDPGCHAIYDAERLRAMLAPTGALAR
jgi:uncharacterized protein YecE (DUF72 family)